MDRNERLYRIEKLLHEYQEVPRVRSLNELKTLPATIKRDVDRLCERLNASLEYDADTGGYRFGIATSGVRYELPAIRFNADEMRALLTMQQRLQELHPGLLTPHIRATLDWLRRLLDSFDTSVANVQKCILVLRIDARHIKPNALGPISATVLGRRQLEGRHSHRNRYMVGTGALSPQRLIHSATTGISMHDAICAKRFIPSRSMRLRMTCCSTRRHLTSAASAGCCYRRLRYFQRGQMSSGRN